MRKIREVLRLKYELGFTHRMIAKALRVAVGTVSEYLAKAKKGGLSWPLPEELSDGELEAGLFPPPGSSGARPGLDYAHNPRGAEASPRADVAAAVGGVRGE